MSAHVENNILSELHTFIKEIAQIPKNNPLDISKTAISLLKTLPTARDSILEYFCKVFDISVNNYIVRIEIEIATGSLPETSMKEEATVSEIHSVLCNFVSSNSQAWAPIISKWSLELLGELSSKYAGRAHVSAPANLNETLQLWMGCRSTRTLIDITTQCLTCLMDTDSETWINALLNTSVKHSPNFDWVVAHVGNCFPNTVIIRVLSCGLKDFCQHKSAETGKKAPKLISVVGILGHLAVSHFKIIKKALLELFTWSLQPYNLQDLELKHQKLFTIPFLLQLASMSSILLNALSSNISETLTIDVISRILIHVKDWSKYFGSPKILQEIIVNLILNCEIDGSQIIYLLVEYLHAENEKVGQKTAKEIQETIHDILESVLQELDSILRTEPNYTAQKLLNSLIVDISDLHYLLLQPEKLKYETAARIILLIGKRNFVLAVQSLSFMLRATNNPDHLAIIVKLAFSLSLQQNIEIYLESSSVFGRIFKNAFLESTILRNTHLFSDEQMWFNILTLLKWDKSNKVDMLQPDKIKNAILINIKDIIIQLNSKTTNKQIKHILAEILYITFTSVSTNRLLFSPEISFNLVHALISYFFLCLNDTNIYKVRGCNILNTLFSLLISQSTTVQVLALREILERSLFQKESLLFGAEPFKTIDHNVDCNDLLLHKNNKHSTIKILTHRHSSVYHSGIIGKGKRSPKLVNPLTKEEITINVEYLVNFIKACCTNMNNESTIGSILHNSPVSLEALTIVSLLLVHFISPDVMYNGLPWPEEEFSKVTIERDLYIRRLFNSMPILWKLLRLIAMYRPVLCYCSVLLRALTATILHQWGTGTSSPELIKTTGNLVDVLAMGQLIPPPLSAIHDLISTLNSVNVVQLLRAIWNYLRDHIPSPALFTCDSNGLHWRDPAGARPLSIYTDVIRMIMFKNINKCGEFYAQLFINLPDNDSDQDLDH